MPAGTAPSAGTLSPLPPVTEGSEDDAGIAFASANWRVAITDRRHPGMVARQHFKAMVFTYMAEELRTGTSR
jgi:hypothetical protein